MLDRVDTHEPGPTGSSQGIESRTTVRTRITGLVPAENPPVQGRGPEVAKGAGRRPGRWMEGTAWRAGAHPQSLPLFLRLGLWRLAPHQTSHL